MDQCLHLWLCLWPYSHFQPLLILSLLLAVIWSISRPWESTLVTVTVRLLNKVTSLPLKCLCHLIVYVPTLLITVTCYISVSGSVLWPVLSFQREREKRETRNPFSLYRDEELSLVHAFSGKMEERPQDFLFSTKLRYFLSFYFLVL